MCRPNWVLAPCGHLGYRITNSPLGECVNAPSPPWGSIFQPRNVVRSDIKVDVASLRVDDRWCCPRRWRLNRIGWLRSLGGRYFGYVFGDVFAIGGLGFGVDAVFGFDTELAGLLSLHALCIAEEPADGAAHGVLLPRGEAFLLADGVLEHVACKLSADAAARTGKGARGADAHTEPLRASRCKSPGARAGRHDDDAFADRKRGLLPVLSPGDLAPVEGFLRAVDLADRAGARKFHRAVGELADERKALPAEVVVPVLLRELVGRVIVNPLAQAGSSPGIRVVHRRAVRVQIPVQTRRIKGIPGDGVVGEEPPRFGIVVACAEVEEAGLGVVEVAGVCHGGVAGEAVGLAAAVASRVRGRPKPAESVVPELCGHARGLAFGQEGADASEDVGVGLGHLAEHVLSYEVEAVGVASEHAAGGDVGLGHEAATVPDGEGAAFGRAVLSDAPSGVVVVEGGGDGAAGGDFGEAVPRGVGEVGFRRRAAGRRDGLGDLVAVGVEAVGGVRAGD